MKKLFIVFIAVVLLVTGCHKTDPGYVSLKVSMSGSDRGEIEVLNTGRHAVNPVTEECHDFPTFTTNTVYQFSEKESDNEEFVFQSSEGMKVEADIGVSYYFDQNKIVLLYQTYRQGPDEIRNIVVKNAIRDSFNKIGSRYVVDDIIGAKKEQIINEVYQDVKEKLSPYGIEIQTVSWYNPPRAPESVTEALNMKVTASQEALKVENEIATARAEAEKEKVRIDTLNYEVTSKAEAEADAIIAKATAEAEANKKIAESLTPELIEYMKIQSWDGANPKIVGVDSQSIIVDGSYLN